MLLESDIKAQLNQLVFPGFVTSHGWKRLADIPRYLSAIEKRMEKLAIDPNRDRAQMSRVENVILQWQQWLAKLSEKQKQQEEVQNIRWMIEELRVSLFAQQIGTPYPISDKRILQAIESISLS